MKPVIVIGGGGHAKVLIEALRLQCIDMVGVTDQNPEMIGTLVHGVPVIGIDDVIRNYQPQSIKLVNGLGSIGKTKLRTELYQTFSERGYCFKTVIHPSAIIASDALLGEGVQVMACAVIQPGCVIGRNSIINTKTSVDHDCQIGEHVHLAPGVTLSGNVIVGNGAHIGTGATVIQGITVGNNCLVAAGALVIRDVPEGVTVMGSPAQVKAS